MIELRTGIFTPLAGLLFGLSAHAATWNAGNGDYSLPTNWNPIGVPCIEMLPAANTAVIDTPGVIVSQDVALCSVEALTLGVGTTLRLQDGTDYNASSLDIAGAISGLGGDLTAAGASFTGTAARVNATLGSTIDFDAASLDATSVPVTTVPLLSASGGGSMLSLSALASLDASFNSANTSIQQHIVEAADGGVVDLSALTNVTLPTDREDRVLFQVSDSASLNLDSLSVANGLGQAFFNTLDGGSLSLPALSAITAGRFQASGGGQITANASAWTLNSASLFNNNYTLVLATNAGSNLDLSGLTMLDASFNSTNGAVQAHTITATDGGAVDLSGLQSVTVPADREDQLRFEVSDTATLNLDSLATVSGLGNAWFSATAGGQLNLPSLGSLAAARFFAAGGGQISANVSGWTLSSATLFNNNYVLASATDPGSSLDLSGLGLLAASFNSSNGAVQSHSIVAAAGASIDLSGLTGVILPADVEDQLVFEVSDTATLNLDSLAVATGGGQAYFRATDGGSLALPALGILSSGRFEATGGGQITANGSNWTLDSSALFNDNYLLMFATDPTSTLALTALATLDAGFNSSNGAVQAHTVSADNGGVIDLGGINNFVAPQDPEDILRLEARDGATLALGPLSGVSGAGRVSVELNAPGATLQFPRGLDAVAAISVLSIADANVAVTGDLSFRHAAEADFNLEFARVSVTDVDTLTIEAGGTDEGTLPMASPNFGFAQLIVGSPAQATSARLVDEVDNGNGYSLCAASGEALYLYGFDVGIDADGLRISNGSTLDLGGVNLYAAVGGVLMHINALLTPGVPFPWDEGFIVGDNPPDTDGDGVVDSADNCVLEANPGQEDTDADGYGNACDADLNGDVVVNSVDLGQLRLAFFATPGSPNWNPNADFNNDGAINVIDLGIMKALFFAPPGPSCVAPM